MLARHSIVAGCVLSFAAVLLSGGGLARAQETFLFHPRSVATPGSPVVEIDILAAFHPDDFAFASTAFAIETNEPGYVGVACLLSLPWPCPSSIEIVEGRFMHGIREGQLHFPAGGIIGDSRNPLPIVRVSWRAETFEPRDVPIRSFTTTRFDVYVDGASSVSHSRVATFAEGAGLIRVRRCAAECNGDDALDIFDFLCFFNAFVQGDPYADFDGDGDLTVFDFIAFQNAFAAGCPS